jgi:hypothetical protein
LLFGGVDACGIKQGLKTNSEDLNRHKSYFLANVIVPLPMDALFDASPTPMVTKTTTFGGTTIQKSDQNTNSIPAPYWTNIEVSAGVLVGVRVGFNPGELLDFLLGFTTLDIYGDDVHPDAFEKAGFVDPDGMRRRMQQQENKQ